jgi:ABC-type Fe3+ transport system permease subunit
VPLYDSPLPLLAGWSLYLLPLALATRLLSQRPAQDRGRHAAVLLLRAAVPARRRAGRWLWLELEGRGVLVALGVCCAAAAGEVVLGHLLAPAGMPVAAPRLYNLMHYGQTAGLSAMVAWLLAALLLLLAAVLFGLRLLRRGVGGT